MEDIFASESKINFIPCLKWVRQGVAKSNPEKVQLNKEELVQIINETKAKLSLEDEDDDDNENGETPMEEEAGPAPVPNDDEFNLEKYDEDDEEAVGNLGIASIAELPTEAEENFSDTDESEKDDEIIKPDDNLILVGRVDGDASILEVYVQNEREGSLYVHHDLLLPAFPLCMEWLDHEPGHPKGSYVAVGTMDPVIDIWDLDVINCLEPAYSLGRKGSRKKGITGIGHRDAVLDLAWNRNFHHILASGSVDKTIILWDIDQGEPSVTIKSFTDKVQTLEWHPFEAQSLLAGGCDKSVRVFDCRASEKHLTWLLKGEAERVLWNHYNPFTFFAGSSTGTLECYDCRKGQLWCVNAHEKEVTGLSLSTKCPGLLTTVSPDGVLKIWDVMNVEEEQPKMVFEKDLKMGVIHCLEMSPNSPFTLATGGDNKNNNFTVLDIMAIDTVRQHFSTRELVNTEEQSTSAENEAS